MLRNPNLYYGNGRRRRVRRVGRPRRGRGFFSSIGNALRGAHDYIKSNKLVSTVANALGSVGVPYAGAIGKAAGTLGYGRRRRVRRRRGGDLYSILKKAVNGGRRVGRPRVRRGGAVRRRRVVHRRRRGGLNLRGLLSKAHSLVKDNKLISKAASALGHPKIAAVAGQLGYGRRRRRVARRRVVRRRGGGTLFGSITQPAVMKF